LRPAFGRVEADDAKGVLILAFEEVSDDRFEVLSLQIGLRPYVPTGPRSSATM
jgi:hypothetical protein